MIRFEDDDRTRGEQHVLGAVLQGKPLHPGVWQTLCPEDFAHDLHGRIFRHAERLAAVGVQVNPAAVYESMRQDRRKHQPAPALDGVADYLEALSCSKSNPLHSAHIRALAAFHNASIEQHTARVASARGSK
ncbi:DnaB-like helicase N-terminal domain-containing protein [Caballeronia sp. BR00000012568055]|uniref:DnaB-like helicase N-terminal domain-containing protein n=1 Tax=Caballeronia sp. BR00000012568055 TaxID=2918761 RepID=UPI0023F63E8C|nr:DnaB-like helicase N-terminal domain-containing protein [Caballeronia sp. BR00000012568055]